MNMLDYLDHKGNITFRERGLNEVDNLIFSTLSYMKMNGYVTYDGGQSLTLQELQEISKRTGYDTSQMICDPVKLLNRAAQTERFRNVRAGYYSDLYDADKQVQFAAVTFFYDSGRSYIAFRGTDNTLIGWREDFNFIYHANTPGQTAAAEYINYVAGKSGDILTVGGHSKGGNFAIYGSAFCDHVIRTSLIDRVYSNDGPGFNSGIAESDNYNSILDLIEKIIPESSVFGILLSTKARLKIIKSSAVGLYQHNPYSWKVTGSQFEKADRRNFSSILADNTLDVWLQSLDAEELELIISTLFDTLESSGFQTLRDMKAKKSQVVLALIRGIMKLEPDRRKQLAISYSRFFTTGKNYFSQEAKKAIIDLQKKLF